MIKIYAGVLLVFLMKPDVGFSHAVQHDNVKVKRVIVTGHSSEKYLLIYPSNQLEGCNEGYWLSANHPGFKEVFTMAVTAKVTSIDFGIKALNEFRWPGSKDGRFCLIEEAQFN